MPRAKLTLTIPEGVWIGDLSRAHPEAQFRILAALPAEDGGGVGLVEVVSSDHAAVLGDLQTYDEVERVDLLQRHDRVAMIQLETTQPFLLLPVRDSGIALEMPFELQDGEAIWEVTASQERLSALGEQFETFGISFDVQHIRQHIESEQLLTDRQRHLVATAVAEGYYDTPRRCSLTELAEEVGVAKSTCSETLHRAEEKIIKQFVEGERVEPVDAVPGS